MKDVRRRAYHLSTGVLSVAFVVWSALFIYRSSSLAFDGRRYFCLFDDAMVSMRYAWNLAHGVGLVWNPGERVEGYTNPLMVLLMAVPNVLSEKRFAVLAVQCSGIVLVLVSAAIVARIAAHFAAHCGPRERAWLQGLAFASTLCYYPLWYWSLMGMETGLVTALTLLAVLAALESPLVRGHRWLVVLSLALGLGYLARPDSLIPAVVIVAFAVSYWSLRETRRLSRSPRYRLRPGPFPPTYIGNSALVRLPIDEMSSPAVARVPLNHRRAIFVVRLTPNAT